MSNEGFSFLFWFQSDHPTPAAMKLYLDDIFNLEINFHQISDSLLGFSRKRNFSIPHRREKKILF